MKKMYLNPVHVSLAPYLWDALRETRQCILLKSANKVYPDKMRLAETKLCKPESFERHTAESDKWKWTSLNSLRSLDSPQDPIASIKALESVIRTGQKYAGNCYEHAALAYRYLTRHGMEIKAQIKHPVTIICAVIPPPGDHALVIVTPFPAPPFPLLLKNLPESAMICDPWGNIVCPAKDYSEEWRNKMQKWSDRGLHIEIDRGPIDSKRFSKIIDIQTANLYEQQNF